MVSQLVGEDPLQHLVGKLHRPAGYRDHACGHGVGVEPGAVLDPERVALRVDGRLPADVLPEGLQPFPLGSDRRP